MQPFLESLTLLLGIVTSIAGLIALMRRAGRQARLGRTEERLRTLLESDIAPAEREVVAALHRHASANWISLQVTPRKSLFEDLLFLLSAGTAAITGGMLVATLGMSSEEAPTSVWPIAVVLLLGSLCAFIPPLAAYADRVNTRRAFVDRMLKGETLPLEPPGIDRPRAPSWRERLRDFNWRERLRDFNWRERLRDFNWRKVALGFAAMLGTAGVGAAILSGLVVFIQARQAWKTTFGGPGSLALQGGVDVGFGGSSLGQASWPVLLLGLLALYLGIGIREWAWGGLVQAAPQPTPEQTARRRS